MIITSYHILSFYKVPLRDVVDLRSRGCRKLQGGNTSDHMNMSLCEVDDGVVPLLPLLYRCLMCCAGAFEGQRKCEMESFSLCSG